MFVGLVAGGLLAAIDWRAVFWVNVPVGIYGTVWAYLRLRDNGERHRARIDWWGNVTFAVGLSAVLIAVTYGIQPYGGHAMGWTKPGCSPGCAAGSSCWAHSASSRAGLPSRCSSSACSGSGPSRRGLAGLACAIARGGLQFMLIIWLQGIWLPLHGYDYSERRCGPGFSCCPSRPGPRRGTGCRDPVGPVGSSRYRHRRTDGIRR